MTQQEVLQRILLSYAEGHKTISDVKGNLSKLTFEEVTIGLGFKQLARDHFKGILIEDGHLKRYEYTSDGEPLSITNKGVKYLKDGGFLKEEHLKNIAEKKLIYEASNIEWVYKTRLYPYIISALAFIISVIALIRSFSK